MTEVPNVFISYAREDAEFVTRLGAGLEALGLEVWTYKNDLEPGVQWAKAIEEALGRSKNVLFVLSEKANKSSWLRTEAAIALTQGGKRVIPIYCTKHAEVPFILRPFKGMDFSDPSSYPVLIERLAEVLHTDFPDSDVEIEQGNLVRERIVRLETSLFEREMARREELEHTESKMFTLRLWYVAIIAGVSAALISILIKIPAETVAKVIAGTTGLAAGLVVNLVSDLIRRVRKRSEGSE